MFLTLLNQEEKDIFWNLAGMMVNADGNFSDEEVAVLKGYTYELGEKYNDLIFEKLDFESIIRDAVDCSSQIKKIIFFELLGLAYADGDYSEEENGLMNKLKKVFSISDDAEKKMMKCVEELLEVYQNIFEVINA